MRHCPAQSAFGQPYMEANRKLFGGEEQPSFEARNLVAGGQYLKKSLNYFCDGELRLAAIQRGVHQLTTNQGLTLRERHRWFLAEWEPMGLPGASATARFPSRQLTFQQWGSIAQGLSESRIPIKVRQLLSCLSAGRSRASSLRAQSARSQQPSASEADLCQANRLRMWNIIVATTHLSGH